LESFSWDKFPIRFLFTIFPSPYHHRLDILSTFYWGNSCLEKGVLSLALLILEGSIDLLVNSGRTGELAVLFVPTAGYLIGFNPRR
jgi:hypothetical protein